MRTVEFHGWLLESDEITTRAAYSTASTQSRYRCDCVPCLNFEANRSAVYPAAAVELFSQLGIDPNHEAEYFHYGKLPSGLHFYGGWLHFVGTILQKGEPSVRITPSFALS